MEERYDPVNCCNAMRGLEVDSPISGLKLLDSLPEQHKSFCEY